VRRARAGARGQTKHPPSPGRAAGAPPHPGRLLLAGRGHNLYGESAWPSDILYVFPPVVLALGAGLAGLAVACPPGAALAPADPFLTPREILPEYYLYPAFNLIRALSSKVAGAAAAAALVFFLGAGAPFGAEAAQHSFQSPLRRPAALGSCLAGAGADLGATAGAARETEPSAPAPQTRRRGSAPSGPPASAPARRPPLSTGERPFFDALGDRRFWLIHSAAVSCLLLGGAF
jgi:cytochrome b6-f complex subunit 4